MEAIDALIGALRKASDDEEVARITAELAVLCTGAAGADARSHIESAARGEVLEVQWELEEIVERTTPAPEPTPEPEPEPEPEPPAPDRQLTAADLVKVYDQPGALILHRTNDGKRWFATQGDPRTGQPQTFELHPNEIDQVKSQLLGSPYWIKGPAASP